MPSVRAISSITDAELRALEKRANSMRKDLLKMLKTAGSGHSAGPLGLADIFSALYFHILHHRPSQAMWKDRDRLLLSCGHNVPIRYVAMAHAGYFPKSELKTLRKLGTKLQGHPEITHLPALENTSGPLGDGGPQSCGMAYVAKQDRLPWHTYCILSEGDLEAGITWEAAMFAGKNDLHNLTWIVDRNNIQIDGYTEDIMPLEPIVDKFEAFNWTVIEIDGHNIMQFVDACRYAQTIWENPVVIIAHTIPGRGVDFMEFEPSWHGKPPGNQKELKEALKDLRTLQGTLNNDAN